MEVRGVTTARPWKPGAGAGLATPYQSPAYTQGAVEGRGVRCDCAGK